MGGETEAACKTMGLKAASVIVQGRVDGEPAPMGSHKYIGKGRVVNDNPRTAPWQEHVRWNFRTAYNAVPHRGAVRVELTFCMQRPRAHYGTGKNSGRLRPSAPMDDACTVRPDVDKLVRAVLDCGTGILWADDAQITRISASKVWGSAPCMKYTIEMVE